MRTTYKPVSNKTTQVCLDDGTKDREIIKLVNSNGCPVKAGELAAGQLYEVDLDSGHVRPIERVAEKG